MPTFILGTVLLAALIAIVVLGAYTITKFEDKRRHAFIAMMLPAFLYVMGYLLVMLSRSEDGAMMALKVMYLGSAFVPVLFLVFVAQYCEHKLNRFALGFLVAVSAIIIALVWTSNWHTLFYTDLWFAYYVFPTLITVGGPLYSLPFLHGTICMLYIIGIIVRTYKKAGKSNRKTIIFLSLIGSGAGLVIVSQALFLLDPFDLNLNYIVLAIVVILVFYYISIVKKDIFDIISQKTQPTLDSMSDAYIVIDDEKRLLWANEWARELFPVVNDLKKHDLLGSIEGLPPELIEIADSHPYSSVKFELPGEIYCDASINPILGKSGALIGNIILIRDITESVATTKKLEEMAYKDALTGILSRRKFLELAEKEIERIKRSGTKAHIVIFDLDHFKNVNDVHGHLVGDKALALTAQRVTDAIRPCDLFGRFGGEEFILLVSDIDFDNMQSYAQRIRKKINDHPMDLGEVELSLSISIGVASTASAATLEKIIDNADKALYKAKQLGRNRVEMHS